VTAGAAPGLVPPPGDLEGQRRDDRRARARRRLRPSARTAAAAFLTVVGLGGLLGGQVVLVAPGVERDLEGRALEALQAAGIDSVDVRIDGRDATLSGTTKDLREASAAEQAVLTVAGMRYVDSAGVRVGAGAAAPGAAAPATTTRAPAPPAAPVQTRVVAVADQGRVLLAGALPDTATAQAVAARLGDTYGTANARTTTATTDGAGTAGLDALVATLAALGPDADTVTVALDGGRITVAGGVTSQATKAAALAAARKAVTKPADVVDRLTLGTGVASPKQVAAQLDSIPPVTYGATATAPNAVGRSMLSAVGFVLSLRSRATVTLEGHSDVSGDAALDLRRSLDRARSAEAYLVGQGLPGARILTTGLGSQNPAVAGDSAQADAANRRLVVRGGS